MGHVPPNTGVSRSRSETDRSDLAGARCKIAVVYHAIVLLERSPADEQTITSASSFFPIPSHIIVEHH